MIAENQNTKLKINSLFKKPEKYIGPGDYYASKQDIIISTLLGSCISVALFDPKQKIGGMNHFMLPFPKKNETGILSRNAKYGINAMEILINELIKKGCVKNDLIAKVFGGSTLLNYDKEAVYDIPKMNISFAFEFLRIENIPVESYSVGGILPRKIYFFPVEGKVKMKNSVQKYDDLIKKEARYAQTLREATLNAGKVILF